MNKDELLKLLDLSGKDVASEPKDSSALVPAESPAPASVNPTALELDEWALRKGRELLAENERLQELDLAEHAVADFRAAAFEPEPRLLPDCSDPLRRQFMAQLLETPDYRSLHTTTMLNEPAAALAAVAFAEQFVELQQESAPGKDAMEREMSTLRAVGRAVNKAADEVEELSEDAAALGLGPGNPGSNDAATIAALFKRVRSNPMLKRICELAGRYRRMAQSKQRLKTTHGYDDMVGVTLDGDVGRLLPHELAKLTMEEFELEALRRLVERQMMCRQYQAVERVAKGPILIVVDESGSMMGAKVQTAKALALALAWVARQQRRWAGLVAFSGESGERLLGLPPGRWDEDALMDWLTQFIGRGSSCDIPVRELPDYYRRLGCPLGRTDVILITDALAYIELEWQSRFNAWKKEVRARIISLVVESDPGDLENISDEVHRVSSLSVEETAVERVLSI